MTGLTDERRREIEIETVARIAAAHWRLIERTLSAADGAGWAGAGEATLAQVAEGADQGRLFWAVADRQFFVVGDHVVEVTLPPLYVMFAAVGWLNTYQVQIVPSVASVFGLFMIRQYMLTIPNALLEAARTVKGRKMLAAKTGISEQQLLEWANFSDHMRIPGMGKAKIELIRAAGVTTVRELGLRNPSRLAQSMKEANTRRRLVRACPTSISEPVTHTRPCRDVRCMAVFRASFRSAWGSISKV